MVPEAPFEARLTVAKGLLARAGAMAYPVHVADQAAAASRDARALLIRLGVVDELLTPGRLTGLGHVAELAEYGHRAAYLVAGVVACRPCWHLRTGAGGPQPMVVSLPTRRTDCTRCATTVRRPVVPDDACDICGETAPGGRFWPVRAQCGAFVIGGDMCRDCAAVVSPEVAA